ncbi:MAG: flotillin domain-containing protein, partial [Alteromonas sp.]
NGVAGEGGAISTGQGSIAEQVTSAALNYRANAPVVDAMLRELGLVDADSGTLNDLLNGNNGLTADAKEIVHNARIIKPNVESAPSTENGEDNA